MSLGEWIKPHFDESMRAAGPEEKLFREKAWREYLRQGLPDRKNEDWKYSSLTSVAKTALAASVPIVQCDFPLEELTELPELEIEDGFVALMAAGFQTGFELNLEKSPSRPIIVRYHQESADEWLSILSRIRLADGVRASMVEIFTGAGFPYLRTNATVLEMGRGARLTWVRLQQEGEVASHFSEIQARLEAEAMLSLTQVNGGAAWSRTSLKAELLGEGADVQINGLSFGRAQQHVDQRVRVRHKAAHTNSSQLFKGVLKDHARGVLNGKIHIFPGAQKVNSNQLNHNLLLSSTAEADTKPELEIYADDVKANHGASIGRMDEDKLFYLMSRGISRSQAREMLAQAFVTDVIMKIPDIDLREAAEEHVRRILPDFVREMESP